MNVGHAPPITTPLEPKRESKPNHKKEQHQRKRATVHISTAPPPAPKPSPPPSQPESRPPSNYQNFKYDCILCSVKHPLFLCPRFGTMTVEQRMDHIRALHLCANCLAPGHKTADCRSYGRCRTCRDKHNTLVHQDTPPSPTTTTQTAANNPVATTSNLSVQASLTMTSQVMLAGSAGRKLVVRALLDSGASMSLISAKAANTLQLPKTNALDTFSGVQDSQSPPSDSLVDVCMSSLQGSSRPFHVTAALGPKVTCDLPLQDAAGVRNIPHLKDLKLADPTFYLPGQIDLLLGEDILSKLFVPPDMRVGPEGTPVAWKTVFGWAIRGPYTPDSRAPVRATSNLALLTVVESIDRLLTRFLKTEEPFKDTVALTPEEVYVQGHYTDNHVFLPASGRYEVTLPRKPSSSSLGESRTQALQRYISNERSLMRKEAFQKLIQVYLDLGHAQPVPPSSLDLSIESYYQQLWEEKLGWDDPVSSQYQFRHRAW